MQTNTTHTKLYYFQSFSKAGRKSLNNRFIFPLSLSENMTKKYSSYTLEVSLMNDTKYWGGSGKLGSEPENLIYYYRCCCCCCCCYWSPLAVFIGSMMRPHLTDWVPPQRQLQPTQSKHCLGGALKERGVVSPRMWGQGGKEGRWEERLMNPSTI